MHETVVVLLAQLQIQVHLGSALNTEHSLKVNVDWSRVIKAADTKIYLIFNCFAVDLLLFNHHMNKCMVGTLPSLWLTYLCKKLFFFA